MQGAKILCICPTPALQRVMVFPRLQIDQVNRAVTTLDGIAGKAVNVAKVLKECREAPAVFGFAGGATGKKLSEELGRRGISTHFIPVEPPTRQCITVLDHQANTQTELVEESQAVPESAYLELLALLRAFTSPIGAVVCSGTLTPNAPTTFYRECVKLAKARQTMSILDAQGAALLDALSAKPDLVKPNRAEIGKTLGRTVETESDLKTAACELGSRGARMSVFTSGAGTAIAFDGNSFWRITSAKVDAINPIGSGDAFTAALTLRLLKGDELGEACRWGAAAGAANALTLMPGELSYEDVQRIADRVTVEKL
jgi:tagatose 6-phosphate kinase